MLFHLTITTILSVLLAKKKLSLQEVKNLAQDRSIRPHLQYNEPSVKLEIPVCFCFHRYIPEKMNQTKERSWANERGPERY